MNTRALLRGAWGRAMLASALAAPCLDAAPVVTRLTPPSSLFSFGDPSPVTARFLPGQRFDLQATIRPDNGRTIERVEFLIDGNPVAGNVTLAPGTVDHLPAGTMVATLRAINRTTPGVRVLTVRATQSDGAVATATGNFEIVPLTTPGGRRARNVIVLIGDGMGLAHRTAARVLLHGVSQGMSLGALAMDTLAHGALVKTPALNSVITDSAAGASAYATGNKADFGQGGVFPDDTKDAFDNPRVELLAEYLARTRGAWLGIVTTSDVTDATPAAFTVHSQDRVRSIGIADALLDEATPRSNLRVLLGGGRRNFLPDTTPGSARVPELDGGPPAELAESWGVAAGRIDPGRDLLADFRAAGFAYAGSRTQLAAVPTDARRLLGLFSLGHMNAALDRIEGRRGRSGVVNDFGFPDQPMLDEMTAAALAVLRQNEAGFVLMVEGALIDKHSHLMDSERWLQEVIEFDRAVARALAFAAAVPDTLVLVTADHETGGVNLIGRSRLTQAELASRAAAGGSAGRVRDETVSAGVPMGFPHYTILADGYPETMDVDRRMLIGYAANADRYEDWLTNAKPTGGPAGYPGLPIERDAGTGFLVTGQVPGPIAAHTGTDVPLSASGVGAASFSGVIDNTDVFFKLMQAVVGGTPAATPSILALPADGATSATAQRLLNLSTRGTIAGPADSLTGGFVLAGSQPHRLLIRGVGPALAAHGVTNPLSDPVLVLLDASGNRIDENDNWDAADNAAVVRDASARVGAFALPSGSRDAALLISLPAGAYTVRLSGRDGASGAALLEIYELP